MVFPLRWFVNLHQILPKHKLPSYNVSHSIITHTVIFFPSPNDKVILNTVAGVVESAFERGFFGVEYFGFKGAAVNGMKVGI